MSTPSPISAESQLTPATEPAEANQVEASNTESPRASAQDTDSTPTPSEAQLTRNQPETATTESATNQFEPTNSDAPLANAQDADSTPTPSETLLSHNQPETTTTISATIQFEPTNSDAPLANAQDAESTPTLAEALLTRNQPETAATNSATGQFDATGTESPVANAYDTEATPTPDQTATTITTTDTPNQNSPTSALPTTRRLTATNAPRALGIPAGGEHRHFRVRSQSNGTWSNWLELTTDPESGTLVWLDAPATAIEIQGLADDQRILLINPGTTPPSAQKSANLIDDAPEIKGRADWCPAPFSCPKGANPTITRPTHLIVHHTASANSATDFPALMRSFWELHVKGNGWDDIGYNFLIDPNGTAYEGRGDGVLGAHFSGVNTATSGISMIGTYTELAPTQAALDKLRDLLVWQAKKYDLDPNAQTLHAASGLDLNVISGHRDAGLSPRATSRTECPGIALYPLLPELREKVCASIERCLAARQRPNTCATATAPCLSQYGTVNSANFDPRPVAAGSIAAAFGANLTRLTARVNNRPATVFGGNANQLNFLVPANTEPGTARLQLLDGATVKAERLIWVTETAPAIYAVLNHDDQVLNTPSAPAANGRPITIYLAGAQSNLPWTATIGGTPAGLLYLGPAPGFPGLWQSNLTVPITTRPGNYPLVITVSGVPSAPVTLHTRAATDANGFPLPIPVHP